MDVMNPQHWPLVGRDKELEHALGGLAEDHVRGSRRLSSLTCMRPRRLRRQRSGLRDRDV